MYILIISKEFDFLKELTRNNESDFLNHLKSKPISKDMLKNDPHDLDDHFLSCKAVDFEVVKKYLDEEAW